MDRIDALINQYCPEGVEYRTLGEIGQLIRGNGLQKTDLSVDEAIGCIHYGQIYTFYNSFTSTTKSFVSEETALKLRKVDKNDLIIATTSENIEDVCKTVAWLGENTIVTGGHTNIFKHSQNAKFLSYYFQTKSFFDQKKKIAQGTKVIEVSSKKLATIKIPIPPLPIQQEIVSILDKFNQLEAELKTKLEAELKARKVQYEFYKNELLRLDDKQIKWKSIGETCSLRAGKSISANQIFPKPTEDHCFPCIGGNGLRGYTNSYSHNGEYSIIGRQGALCGNVKFANDKFYATEHAVVVTPSDQLLSKYLFYLLSSFNLNQYATNGAQPGLSVSKLNDIQIPIPSIETQKHVIEILDKFDKLVNDLSSGLPAEIKARRKQYEYYREKLLTFKPLADG